MPKSPKTVKISKAKTSGVYWLKFSYGDELIARVVKEDAKTITVNKPCAIVYMGDNMILSPFGLFSEGDTHVIEKSHLAMKIKVADAMSKYYFISLEYASDHKSRYTNILLRLANKFERAILEREMGPSDEELNQIEKEEEGPSIQVQEDVEAIQKKSKKEDLVDRVARLAEEKGLGKKNEATSKE